MQPEKANCTREEARQLLHDLRAAYQALNLGEREQIRSALAELGGQRIARSRWQPTGLALEAR